MNPITHTVLRASAGSGKTWQLSNRYLQLLHLGVPPDTILATTFTRKAAGEILGRVLDRLATAADNDKASAKLLDELKLPGKELPEPRAMLVNLCASLHRVSISTIDSFFNRVAHSFRHELDIPPQPAIVGDDDPLAVQLRRQAIDALLADHDPQTLVDLLRRLHHDLAIRSVTEAIDSIVRNLYDVYRQAPDQALWSTLQHDHPLSEPQLADALNRLVALVDADAEKKWGKQVATALSKAVQAAQQRDWPGLIDGGLGKPLTPAGTGQYYKKPIPPPIADVIRPLVHHAAAALLTRLDNQNRATFTLLQRFDSHYSRLRRLHHVMLFSDLPQKLARELPRRDDLLTEVYYRLDAKVSHLLLDEFQDTSLEQWQVLQPFAQEITSQPTPERSFFCVGDAKQSIYAWRGGCPEILDGLIDDLHLDADAQPPPLAESFRSSPIIIDAINGVFRDIPSNPALADFHDQTQQWHNAWEEHNSHFRSSPGYVELMTSPAPAPEDSAAASSNQNPDEDEPPPNPTHLDFVAHRTAALSKNAPGNTIGVLVYTNNQIPPLINALRKLNIPASGEGGNPLTDDPAVNAVLAALTLADHPGDTIASFHVLNSSLGEILGLTSTHSDHVAPIAAAIRQSLLAHGYGRLIADWTRALAPFCNPRNIARLTQLTELAQRYDPDLTLRPARFVRFVEQTAVEEPSPAPVRVMSIHKAKGLEFDIVVLPQLTRTMGKVANDAVLTVRDHPTAPITAVHRYANSTLRALSPQLQQAFDEEQSRRFRDDLCAFYVAMTRPRHALHLFVHPLTPKQDGTPRASGLTNPTPASILRQTLRPTDFPESFDGNQLLYAHGDPNWPQKLPKHKSSQIDAPEAQPLPKFVTQNSKLETSLRSLPQISPSSLADSARVRVADLLTLEPDAARNYGSIFHNWLAQIQYLDTTPPPDDATLRQLASVAVDHQPIDPAWLTKLMATFRRALAQPSLRALLTKPANAPAVQLWLERPFAVRADNRLLRGQFDRVAVTYQNDRPISAALIDYKTDSLTPDRANLPALADRYRPQLEAYRSALSAMLDLDPAHITAALFFLSTDLLHPL